MSSVVPEGRPQAMPCFAAAAATIACAFDHLGILPVERAAEAERQVAGADEEAVDAGGAGDGVDVGESLGGFDLDDQERVGVGGGRIGEGALKVEIVVEAGAVEAALPDRGNFTACASAAASAAVFTSGIMRPVAPSSRR